MRKIRTWMILLLCAALLLSLFGCGSQEEPTFDENIAVMLVGDVPVSAVTYRYHLNERYDGIEKNKLYDWDVYLSYFVNPTIYYPYAYYDTRTEEGMKKLREDVLNELALESAAIYAAKQAGYQLTVEDRYYIEQTEDDAKNALEEAAESYGSAEAFFAATGFTEQTFVEMYQKSREASIDFNKLLDAYRETHTLDDAALEEGYARIVKETFVDRYADGMYSKYLGYYLSGTRSYPSLYIPDDAIFVRLFVHTNTTEEQAAAFTALAGEDFNALYTGADNEFTAQGTVGDLAVAPNDSFIDGLYEAAKDVPIGEIGTMTKETDGGVTFCLFLRVEGQTGTVPIDRYPGVRERIENQLTGTFCMDTLRALVDDPAVTTRNGALFDMILPDQAK